MKIFHSQKLYNLSVEKLGEGKKLELKK